jgi:hypothetical protein
VSEILSVVHPNPSLGEIAFTKEGKFLVFNGTEWAEVLYTEEVPDVNFLLESATTIERANKLKEKFNLDNQKFNEKEI